MTNNTLVKSRTRTEQADIAHAEAQISQSALATMGATSTVIGLWAVACFVGGMIASGGPLSMAKAWFTAVTGI